MTEKLRKIAESKTFQRAILAVILLAGVLVGLETYPEVVAEHGKLLDRLDGLVLWIFVVEALSVSVSFRPSASPWARA